MQFENFMGDSEVKKMCSQIMLLCVNQFEMLAIAFEAIRCFWRLFVVCKWFTKRNAYVACAREWKCDCVQLIWNTQNTELTKSLKWIRVTMIFGSVSAPVHIFEETRKKRRTSSPSAFWEIYVERFQTKNRS